eukprot:TRINITY_DN18502_c0_g1_i2.p1 TRINITY_DN18502_c0_g1~~TRINITY_DN18502_c0_g1_i2.p1  ORF type:complete len:226 (-),score=26.04 TRINITY_DN18502_c0_g1_i2:80-757(-)
MPKRVPVDYAPYVYSADILSGKLKAECRNPKPLEVPDKYDENKREMLTSQGSMSALDSTTASGDSFQLRIPQSCPATPVGRKKPPALSTDLTLSMSVSSNLSASSPGAQSLPELPRQPVSPSWRWWQNLSECDEQIPAPSPHVYERPLTVSGLNLRGGSPSLINWRDYTGDLTRHSQRGFRGGSVPKRWRNLHAMPTFTRSGSALTRLIKEAEPEFLQDPESIHF